MNFILSLVVTLSSIVFVTGQPSEKNTIIPYPRIGRGDGRFFMEGKRNGNGLSPGLIPFPRIGRSGSDSGIHEGKRQLIPFPRVGKRPYWRLPMEPYPSEYEDFNIPLMDPASFNAVVSGLPDFNIFDESDIEKRNAAGTTNNGSNNGGMWFGPRLGKRKKRSVETESSTERTHDTSLDTRMLLKILHNFNWAIVPIKERRTFTPRLGRSSEESSFGTVHHRSEPYTPRLGRSREVSSSDFDGEDETNEPRQRFPHGGTNGEMRSKSRGQSEDSSNVGGVPFSPRLGRDHINPRLGRSIEDHD